MPLWQPEVELLEIAGHEELVNNVFISEISGEK
jgi:hypothetical protein